MPSHISFSTSSSLIARVKTRDEQAWNRFVGLYLPVVYRWLRKLGLQPADSADVSQDVFQSLVRKIELFDKDRATSGFRGWLWTVTRNQFLDYCRKRRTHPQAQGGSDQLQQLAELPENVPAEPPSTSADFRNSLAHRALRLIQQDFETRTWQAFWRVTVDEQPTPIVARELQMTEGAVRQAKYRVLLRLRNELDESA